MKYENLNETNALLYAAKHYDNPGCVDTVEFYEDLKRFQYLRRLLNKYKQTGEFRERLIINHINILYNVLGPTPCTRLLFLKLKDHHDVLKPILQLMGYLPDVIYSVGIDNKNIYTNAIISDSVVEQIIKKL